MCLEEKLNELIGANWFREAPYGDLFSMIRSSSVKEIELLSFAYCEIRRRGNAGTISTADKICEELDIKPIPWLMEARGRLSLLDPPPRRNYTCHTYVVLRDGYTEFNGTYGAYVGVTSLSPEERFLQHITLGHPRAANGLPRHGVKLLRSLMVPFVRVPAREKLRYETSLHLALSLAIPKVTGDILDDFREWLPEFQPRLMAELEKEMH
jgi:hypothetical protein